MPTEKLLIQIKDHQYIEVWCDGRDYDPEFEGYRPIYSYKIVYTDENNNWCEYVSDDVHGGINEIPNLNSAAQSICAFLYACQEGYTEDPEHKKENASLFPPEVREWAYQFADEISIKSLELERENL